MLQSAILAVLTLLGILLAQWYQKRRKQMCFLKDLNIPGPDPHLIYGNLKEYLEIGPNRLHAEWTKKYGKVFGYYYGAQPMIVIGDPDILRNVQIKDFNNFINRGGFIPGGSRVVKGIGSHIISERDQVWKNQRAVLTPSFTTGKMKQMVPILKDSIDQFLSIVDQHRQNDREFDIFEMYKALTLDVIGRTAFGIQTNVQNDPDDPFLLAAKEAFPDNIVTGLALLAVCLPELQKVIYPFRVVTQKVREFFGRSRLQELAENCKAIVRKRRSNPQNRRVDLLQLMLDAEMSHSDIANISGHSLTAGYESEIHGPAAATNGSASKKKSYYMNDVEVVSNTFLVLIAGYETTSTALGFTTHILVNHPEIQERIREEVKAILKKDGVLDYTNVSTCKYLEQVFQESMRYYPPVAGFVTRETVADVRYDNLFLPKGSIIQVSLDLYRDPDFWENPNDFDPDRWTPERRGNQHPLAYQAFGAGPRNCIGMRFAQMEAKLALANILLKYKLLPGHRTEKGDLEVVYKLFIMNPKNGIFVKAQKLED